MSALLPSEAAILRGLCLASLVVLYLAVFACSLVLTFAAQHIASHGGLLDGVVAILVALQVVPLTASAADLTRGIARGLAR